MFFIRKLDFNYWFVFFFLNIYFITKIRNIFFNFNVLQKLTATLKKVGELPFFLPLIKYFEKLQIVISFAQFIQNFDKTNLIW
jgi:hypothetical protein